MGNSAKSRKTSAIILQPPNTFWKVFHLKIKAKNSENFKYSQRAPLWLFGAENLQNLVSFSIEYASFSANSNNTFWKFWIINVELPSTKITVLFKGRYAKDHRLPMPKNCSQYGLSLAPLTAITSLDFEISLENKMNSI